MTKILLFGGDRLLENGPLSIVAEYLIKKKIEVLIITNRTRLKKLSLGGITFEDHLKRRKLKFITFDKINEKKVIRLIDKGTFGFSINSTWKFKKNLINAFRGNFYNYHAADLRLERGAGNLSWKILQNNIKYGSISIHVVDQEFDSGNIVAKKKILFSIKKKSILPINFLKVIAKKEIIFLKDFLDKMIKKRKFKQIKQKHPKNFYWPRLDADRDGRINWSWEAKDIVSFIRAFSIPFKGAFTFLGESKIRIYNAEIDSVKKKFHPYQNGIVFRKDKTHIYISNQKGSIKVRISDILFENKKTKFLGKRLS